MFLCNNDREKLKKYVYDVLAVDPNKSHYELVALCNQTYNKSSDGFKTQMIKCAKKHGINTRTGV